MGWAGPPSHGDTGTRSYWYDDTHYRLILRSSPVRRNFQLPLCSPVTRPQARHYCLFTDARGAQDHRRAGSPPAAQPLPTAATAPRTARATVTARIWHARQSGTPERHRSRGRQTAPAPPRRRRDHAPPLRHARRRFTVGRDPRHGPPDVAGNAQFPESARPAGPPRPPRNRIRKQRDRTTGPQGTARPGPRRPRRNTGPARITESPRTAGPLRHTRQDRTTGRAPIAEPRRDPRPAPRDRKSVV